VRIYAGGAYALPQTPSRNGGVLLRGKKWKREEGKGREKEGEGMTCISHYFVPRNTVIKMTKNSENCAKL